MPSALATRPGVKVRYPRVQVLVPDGATDEEADALEAEALYRAYLVAARRAGVEPQPAQVARPRARWRESAFASGPPSPSSVRTAAEFLDCMRALKKWAKVSYEKLEQRAGTDADGASRLPHSSMNRLLAKSNDSRLPDEVQLAAFVLACGLSKEQWREWSMVWADIKSTSKGGHWQFPALLNRFHNRGYGAPSAYSTDLAVRDLATVELPMWSWTSDPTVSNATAGAAPTMRVVVGPTFRG